MSHFCLVIRQNSHISLANHLFIILNSIGSYHLNYCWLLLVSVYRLLCTRRIFVRQSLASDFWLLVNFYINLILTYTTLASQVFN